MQGRTTLVGMEMYLNSQNKSITDDWLLDNETFNKDILLSTILLKGAKFEPLYSDPDYFNSVSSYWWLKWRRTFNNWFDVYDLEFNPLDNYDRREETTDTTSIKGKTNDKTTNQNNITTTNSNTTDTDGTVKDTNNIETTGIGKTTVSDESNKKNDTTTNTTTTDENKVVSDTTTTKSAFNATSGYQPYGKVDVNSNTSDTNKVNGTVSITDKTTDSNTTNTNNSNTVVDTENTINTEKVVSKGSSSNIGNGTTIANGESEQETTYIHTSHILGNIGVTTSTQMRDSYVKSELDNCYDHIADIFLDEMTVKVY